MKVFLAWHNLMDNKLRSASSIAGVCFAMLLVYMQLGFYDSCFRSSTLVYDQLDFDLLLVSRRYVHVRFAGRIPRRYLSKAKSVAGVTDVAPLYVTHGDYLTRHSDARHEVLILGVDPSTQPFRLVELRDRLPQLKIVEAAILDEVMTGKGHAAIQAGEYVQVRDKRIKVVATYRHGAGFIADAELIVSDETLATILPGFTVRDVSLGLIQLDANADPVGVAASINQLMPGDIEVWTRDQIERREQAFFIWNKPMGILFGAGVLLSCAVGVVVLYQVLASAVIKKAKEYATLRAIGHQNAQVQVIVLQQAVLYSVFGVLPATGLAYAVYELVRNETKLPMVMPWQRIVLVATLAILMGGVSGLFVIRRLQRIDPADLF